MSKKFVKNIRQKNLSKKFVKKICQKYSSKKFVKKFVKKLIYRPFDILHQADLLALNMGINYQPIFGCMYEHSPWNSFNDNKLWILAEARPKPIPLVICIPHYGNVLITPTVRYPITEIGVAHTVGPCTVLLWHENMGMVVLPIQ